MKSILSKAIIVGGMLGLLLSFQNCSQSQFSGSGASDTELASELSDDEAMGSSNSDASTNSNIPVVSPGAEGNAQQYCEGKVVRIIDVEPGQVFGKEVAIGKVEMSANEMVFYRFKSPSLSSPKMGKDGGLAYFSADSPEAIAAPPQIVIGLSSNFCDFTHATYSATPNGALRSEGLAAYLVISSPTMFDASYLTMRPDQFYYLQIKTVKPNLRAYVEFNVTAPIERPWLP